MTVYCATTNAGKIDEFRLASEGAFTIEPLPGIREIPAPEETGDTFEANAIQKAMYYGSYTNGLLFAEDSGLEVDALRGAPGVFSARFSGKNATDASNNQKLLEALKDVEHRGARYVCVIALVENGKLLQTFRGVTEGQIMDEIRGSLGFGYDPLFYYPPFERSFAEVSREAKQEVSHRGAALRLMKEFLKLR